MRRKDSGQGIVDWAKGLEPLLPLIALLSPVGFAISVVLNSVWMHLSLGLPYVQIASTADVIMDGLQAMGACVIAVAAIALLSTWGLGRDAIASLKAARLWRSIGGKGFPPGYTRQVHRLTLRLEGWNAKAMLGMLVGVIVLSVWTSMDQRGNLYLSSSHQVPGCVDAKVRWVGSQNVVLNCQSRTVVIRGAENLALIEGDSTCIGEWGVQFCLGHPPGSPPPPAVTGPGAKTYRSAFGH